MVTRQLQRWKSSPLNHRAKKCNDLLTPWDHIDRAAKDQHVQEEEGDGSRSRGFLTIAQKSGQHHHADRQTGAAPDHRPSTTNAIKGQCREEVADGEHPVSDL